MNVDSLFDIFWEYSLPQIQDSLFKILYSHKPMHYNGTEIDTNIQYQYLHAHDKMMDVTQ
jgi:hypothetical protein